MDSERDGFGLGAAGIGCVAGEAGARLSLC